VAGCKDDMDQEVKVVFEPKIFVDIILAALTCSVEVSGLAKVEKDGYLYTVYGEPIIFKQSCSLLRTTFDETAYLLWQERMVIEGTHEEIQKARLWWHSHVWARVGFSARDENTLGIMTQDFDWLLAMVVNKKYQTYLELRTNKPLPLPGIIISEYGFTEKVSMQSLQKLMDERRASMEAIIRERVRVIDGPGDNSGGSVDDD